MNKQLEMESSFWGKVKLELEINAYRDNNRMYIGLVGGSGFCSYPLYLFNPEKLREAAPEDMELFERTVMGITPDRKREEGMAL